MKIGTNKFNFLIVFFFAFANIAIAQTPPPPPGEPTPILPIDEYIYIAIIVSLIFGATLIYNSVKKKS